VPRLQAEESLEATHPVSGSRAEQFQVMPRLSS